MIESTDLLAQTVETLHDLSRVVVVITERMRRIEEHLSVLEQQNQTIKSRIQ